MAYWNAILRINWSYPAAAVDINGWEKSGVEALLNNPSAQSALNRMCWSGEAEDHCFLIEDRIALSAIILEEEEHLKLCIFLGLMHNDNIVRQEMRGKDMRKLVSPLKRREILAAHSAAALLPVPALPQELHLDPGLNEARVTMINAGLYSLRMMLGEIPKYATAYFFDRYGARFEHTYGGLSRESSVQYRRRVKYALRFLGADHV